MGNLAGERAAFNQACLRSASSHEEPLRKVAVRFPSESILLRSVALLPAMSRDPANPMIFIAATVISATNGNIEDGDGYCNCGNLLLVQKF